MRQTNGPKKRLPVTEKSALLTFLDDIAHYAAWLAKDSQFRFHAQTPEVQQLADAAWKRLNTPIYLKEKAIENEAIFNIFSGKGGRA